MINGDFIIRYGDGDTLTLQQSFQTGVRLRCPHCQREYAIHGNSAEEDKRSVAEYNEHYRSHASEG